MFLLCWECKSVSVSLFFVRVGVVDKGGADADTSVSEPVARLFIPSSGLRLPRLPLCLLMHCGVAYWYLLSLPLAAGDGRVSWPL